MIDYVQYSDTDSLFLNIDKWIVDNIDDPLKWYNKPDEEKIEIISNISKCVEKKLNERMFEDYQKKILNSNEKEFKITYKPEKIVKSGLFIKKKKYALNMVMDSGIEKKKIYISGLEIVRSDTPLMFRKVLFDITKQILNKVSDDDIKKQICYFKNEAKKADLKDVSSNIGINNVTKYTNIDGTIKKGAPWHVKGAIYYNKLLKLLKIENKYPPIEESVKTKVIYVKKNPHNIDAIAFHTYPQEFYKMGIVPDIDKMIDKYLTKKVEHLLEPINKNYLLQNETYINTQIFF